MNEQQGRQAEVKRYRLEPVLLSTGNPQQLLMRASIAADPKGDYVAYADYEALEQQLREAEHRAEQFYSAMHKNGLTQDPNAINALAGERDRLSRELQETQANYEECQRWCKRLQDRLDEAEKLSTEIGNAKDEILNKKTKIENDAKQLKAANRKLRAERDAMKPVVEAVNNRERHDHGLIPMDIRSMAERALDAPTPAEGEKGEQDDNPAPCHQCSECGCEWARLEDETWGCPLCYWEKEAKEYRRHENIQRRRGDRWESIAMQKQEERDEAVTRADKWERCTEILADKVVGTESIDEAPPQDQRNNLRKKLDTPESREFWRTAKETAERMEAATPTPPPAGDEGGEVPEGYEVEESVAEPGKWIADRKHGRVKGLIGTGGEETWNHEKFRFPTRAAAIEACRKHKARKEADRDKQLRESGPQGGAVNMPSTHDQSNVRPAYPDKPTPPQGPFHDAEGNAYRLKFDEPKMPRKWEQWIAGHGGPDGNVAQNAKVVGPLPFDAKLIGKRWIVERIPTPDVSLSDGSTVVDGSKWKVPDIPTPEPTQPETESGKSATVVGGAASGGKGEPCWYCARTGVVFKSNILSGTRWFCREHAMKEGIAEQELPLQNEPTQPGEPAPCHCCGHATTITRPKAGYYRVKCRNPWCVMLGPLGMSRSEAIAAWNRVAGWAEPAPSSLYEAARKVEWHARPEPNEDGGYYAVPMRVMDEMRGALTHSTHARPEHEVKAEALREAARIATTTACDGLTRPIDIQKRIADNLRFFADPTRAGGRR